MESSPLLGASRNRRNAASGGGFFGTTHRLFNTLAAGAALVLVTRQVRGRVRAVFESRT